MIDARIEELIQQEIDGQNSPQDSARLHAILDSDPECRGYFERLQTVAAEMTQVGLVASPETLRDEIAQGLSGHMAPTRRQPRRSWRGSLGIREVFAFATGIAAGIVIFALLSRDLLPEQNQEPTTLMGSMILNPHTGILPIMDRRSIQNGPLKAEVLVRSDSELVVAEIDLRSPNGLEMALEFDLTALVLVGCEQPAAVAGEVVLSPNHLTVRDPREGPYRFVFRKRAEDASSPLELRLNQGDWIARESLRITPAKEASPG